MSTYRAVTRLMPLLLILTGCVGGGSSPASHFYLLEPINDSKATFIPADSRISISLRPVSIPNYVDRPQMVRATAKNTYHLSEFNRWAEGLDHNMTRVLAQNLTQLVPAEVLLTHSSSQAKRATLHLAVNILEFHIRPQGQAGLTAQWSVRKGKQVLFNRQKSYRRDGSKTDYRIMVAALNGCLNLLSQDIAKILRQISEVEDQRTN